MNAATSPDSHLRRTRIGLLGGSFDPVHHAHLALAQAAIDALQLDAIHLIPTGRSWQKVDALGRSTQRAAAHRLAMLQLACNAHHERLLAQRAHADPDLRPRDARWVVDPVEVERDGPSYTIDTLQRLRATLGNEPAFVLILGSDQLRNLPTWHRWRELLDHAHLAVTARPGSPLDDLPADVDALVAECGAEALPDAPSGSIVFFRMQPMAVSSTALRALLGRRPPDPAHAAVDMPADAAELLPAPVLKYIVEHGLYAAGPATTSTAPSAAPSAAASVITSAARTGSIAASADARPFVWLASRSPRRRDLLASVGIDCELLLDPDEERAEALERIVAGEAPAAYVQRVVLAKAAAAIERLADRSTPVVVADTTVAIGGAVLGKPADDDEARRMLGRLAGRVHRVITGVAVIDPRPATPRVLHRLQVSRVRFRRLDAATIDRYVASGEPRGKAGGYAIQGRAASFVQSIEGSHSGIVGLPLFETCALLRKAGLHGV